MAWAKQGSSTGFARHAGPCLRKRGQPGFERVLVLAPPQSCCIPRQASLVMGL